MMHKDRINELGDELYQALRTQSTTEPLTAREGDITIEDAYHISLRMVEQRLKLDGERIVGKKIGVTSKPVQEMLNVFQPDFGFLTDKMEYADGVNIPIAGNMIQPRAEGEIAFRLKQDLVGPGVTERHRCMLGETHECHRLANNIGTSNHDNFLASQINTGILQHFHDTERRTWLIEWIACHE